MKKNVRTFEWDSNKSEKNLKKHGISFREALCLWDGFTYVIPTRSGNDDARSLVIGMLGVRHWTAVITMRGATVRIISVRRSHKNEERIYDERKNEAQDGCDGRRDR